MQFAVLVEIPAETVEEIRAAAKEVLGREITNSELDAFVRSDVQIVYGATMYGGYLSVIDSIQDYCNDLPK